MPYLRFCALAAIVTLTGCGDILAARVRVGANGVVRPATNSELYDGSYQGHATLVRAAGPGCPVRPRNGVVEIGDATLVFPYTPNLTFAAVVQRDGTMHAESGPLRLDGRIVGNQLAFTITTPRCQSVYRMRYVWNHS